MSTPFTGTPGEGSPGDFVPGAPPVVTSPVGPAGPVTIGTTPVLLASVPHGPWAGPLGRVAVTASSGAFYLGGPNVTSGNGAQVRAPFNCPLFSADQLWACTGSGTVTASIYVGGT